MDFYCKIRLIEKIILFNAKNKKKYMIKCNINDSV